MSLARRLVGYASAAFLATSCPAYAIEPGTKSCEIELSVIPKFAEEATARAACQPDGVVWADSKTGFYYPKFFAEYGKTPHSAYTCYK